MKISHLMFALLCLSYSCNSQNFSNTPSELEILNSIYTNGTYLGQKKGLRWSSADAQLSKKFGGSFNDYLTRVIFSESIELRNGKKMVLITQTKPIDYDCQFCSPLLGVIVLAYQDSSWKVVLNKYFAKLGNWGKASELKFQKIGIDQFGIWFFPGGTLEGITFENSTLYGFVNEDFKELLKLEHTYEDNTGQCDEALGNCYQFSSEIQTITSSNTYFDIIVKSTGKKPFGKKTKAISEQYIYKYSSGYYYRVPL